MDSNLESRGLSEVAEITMGQSPSGDTYNKQGTGTPLLNGPTEFGPNHPTPALWTSRPTRVCNPGDLLFCVRGTTTGRMNWADQQYCLGRGVGSIRARTGVTDTRFIYYTLVGDLGTLLAKCTGSVFANLSKDDLETFQIHWPSPEERASTVKILGALDDKIDLNRRMNRTLESMAQALFQSWFVDFDPVRAKMEGRQPAGMDAEKAALWPDGFQDSKLGLIPNGWRVVRIADICETQYGYTASAVDEPVGPHLLRITDMNKEPWIEWRHVPYCEISSSLLTRYRLHVGDVLVSRMADPGKAAIIEEAVEAVFASYLIRLKTRSLAESYFLYYFLRSGSYLDYAQSTRGGSVQANMNAKVITGCDMVFAPYSIMEGFLSHAMPLRNQVASNLRQNQSLSTIRDALLPQLLSGQLHVSEAEKVPGTRL